MQDAEHIFVQPRLAGSCHSGCFESLGKLACVDASVPDVHGAHILRTVFMVTSQIRHARALFFFYAQVVCELVLISASTAISPERWCRSPSGRVSSRSLQASSARGGRRTHASVWLIPSSAMNLSYSPRLLWQVVSIEEGAV